MPRSKAKTYEHVTPNGHVVRYTVPTDDSGRELGDILEAVAEAKHQLRKMQKLLRDFSEDTVGWMVGRREPPPDTVHWYLYRTLRKAQLALERVKS